MRSAEEMFNLILETAHKDERVRAVYMNGSRTNPNAPKDMFQDFDIVCVVKEIASFIEDKSWIHHFGDLLMMQEPDKNDESFGDQNWNSAQSYGFLMLFTDGNRIDLRLQTHDAMFEGYTKDSLTVALIDKDDILPAIPSPSDIDYYVKRPTEAEFDSYINNFWWCLQNVAKGIWRDELPYAKQMYEETTRVSLDQVVNWWIGIQYDFQVSTGKMGKYFNKLLPEAYWMMYKATYCDSNFENMWKSIFAACELFRTLAQDVATHFHFTYPIDDDRNMMKYLRRVKDLPSDANEII